jgi:hypothetical protein
MVVSTRAERSITCGEAGRQIDCNEKQPQNDGPGNRVHDEDFKCTGQAKMLDPGHSAENQIMDRTIDEPQIPSPADTSADASIEKVRDSAINFSTLFPPKI